MLKKIISCILSIAFVLSTGVFIKGYADSYKNVIYTEDFSYDYPGEAPYGLSVDFDANSTAKVVTSKNEAGKYKNMLLMTDKGEKSLASATIKVPEYKDSITMEVKFKLKKTSTDGYGFIIDFTGNGKRALRICKYSDGASGFNLETNAGTSALTPGVELNDKWFTLKIRLDSKNKNSSLAWESSSLGSSEIDTSSYSFLWYDEEGKRIVAYNRPWYKEFNEDKLTNVTFSTYGVTAGECYIDYITFYETNEEYYPVRKRAASKDMLSAFSPKIRLVPGRINMVYNNEIRYVANPPVVKNGTVFADAESVAELYEMNFSLKKGTCILEKEGKKLAFKEGKNTFLYNTENKEMSQSCFIEDCALYLPIDDVVSLFNDTTYFNSKKGILYIEEKSAFEIEEKAAYLTPEDDISNGMFVVAGYDEYGKLLDLSIKEGSFEKDKKIALNLDSSYTYYKTAAYLWSKDSIAPIVKPKVRINY